MDLPNEERQLYDLSKSSSSNGLGWSKFLDGLAPTGDSYRSL